MKVISFSLWGNNPKYCVGAIRNAALADKIYPGWDVHIVMDALVPAYVWQELGTIGDHIHPILRLDPVTENAAIGDWRGMFWRFEAACMLGVDAMISRDCDSRLSEREAAAVNEWLESDKGFHIMRDHPWHGSHMLGGMWGCKGFALPEFLDLMLQWNQEDRWQTDQDFLNAVVYPLIKDNAMVHDPFFELEPFPKERRGLEFVGKVFDENEITVAEHETALYKYLKARGEPVR